MIGLGRGETKGIRVQGEFQHMAYKLGSSE